MWTYAVRRARVDKVSSSESLPPLSALVPVLGAGALFIPFLESHQDILEQPVGSKLIRG
jgi:hypothetical protein